MYPPPAEIWVLEVVQVLSQMILTTVFQLQPNREFLKLMGLNIFLGKVFQFLSEHVKCFLFSIYI